MWRGIAALVLIALAGCSRDAVQVPAPPRDTSAADLPMQTSTISVPITASLAELEAGLNQQIPRRLWAIDRREQRCVAGQRVKLLGVRAKVTPDIGCRIVGQVTRGRIRLGGSGSTIVARLPVTAVIAARDVGGVLKGETATGTAEVRATIKLSIAKNWEPVGKVDIDYGWTEPPGIDFLGQRIKFVEKADAKLKGVIADLERSLPRELAKLHTRERLAGLWRQGFAVIELNHDRPPAWMRVTPKKLGYGGYRVVQGRVELNLTAEALTETFVGRRPDAPQPTRLPPPAPALGDRGLRFFVPVVADYAQLEPVVKRALDKRAAKGITLPQIGPIDAEFGKVTVYATPGNRLAVGIEAKVKARDRAYTETKGVVWLTGVPVNDAGSQLVRVRDLRVAGRTDNEAVNLLVNLFLDPVVLSDVRTALSHDFAKDYTRVLAAARKAVSGRREGDFVLSANVGDVSNGQLRVTGEGLFLPVEAQGTATIRYLPRKN